jgi:hypothetical protein
VTSNSVKILLLDDDLSKSLTLSLEEVKVLWESDLLVKGKEDLDIEQDLYNTFTKKLILICRKLLEARKLLKDEEFDKIVHLNSMDHFKFSLILKGRMSTIPLVSKILKYASEEILIIVAESRNIGCEKLLIKSFEVRPEQFVSCCKAPLLLVINHLCIVQIIMICARLGGCGVRGSRSNRQERHIF